MVDVSPGMGSLGRLCLLHKRIQLNEEGILGALGQAGPRSHRSELVNGDPGAERQPRATAFMKL